ncbi:zinc finger protein 395 isoform X1 [Lepeophtheirus salmonis]|uniref:zinc finger protein 395 isoform X1 n=1 Tax=Lepeophtheirus salmonis TaxID=72036 RepID=UPI001AE8B5FD|nr:zinc finger protein 704-like isoform X1 [Lepeophtheirus salmonis]
MSTGKRLAKRSIIGTRIAASWDDGKYYPGIIMGVTNRGTYSIKYNEGGIKERKGTELIGPGFQNVTSFKLRAGQSAYITHQSREMKGMVLHHRPNIDEVSIELENGGGEVKKKLEDVRLLESRKSTRLINHNNTDFSKLADFNIVHERQRLNSETSDISHTSSSRKRRSSDSESSGDEISFIYSSGSESDRHTPVMSECTAAMVLMNLSFSPRNKITGCPASGVVVGGSTTMIAPNGGVSPSSSSTSSGVSSLGSSWTSLSAQNPNYTEAEALLQLSNQESDEGILSDQSSAVDSDEPTKRIKTEHVRIIYQCTWPGCNVFKEVCSDIERHIRKVHLRKAEPESEEENDHEEEFYFTEIDVPMESSESVVRNTQALLPPAPSGATAVSYMQNHFTQHQQHNHHKNFNNHHQHTLPSTTTLTSLPLSSSSTYYTPPQHRQQPALNHHQTRLQQRPVHHLLVQSSSLPTPHGKGIQILASGPPAVRPPLLADHMDMARPPHENPEYRHSVLITSSTTASSSNNLSPLHLSPHQSVAAVPITIPVATTASFSFSPSSGVSGTGTLPAPSNNHHHHNNNINNTSTQPSSSSPHQSKYIRLSPKPLTSSTPKSPIRRPRGDAKKCRKVYGMERKELWCTQCKWKKACTRFGESN